MFDPHFSETNKNFETYIERIKHFWNIKHEEEIHFSGQSNYLINKTLVQNQRLLLLSVQSKSTMDSRSLPSWKVFNLHLTIPVFLIVPISIYFLKKNSAHVFALMKKPTSRHFSKNIQSLNETTFVKILLLNFYRWANIIGQIKLALVPNKIILIQSI